MKSYLVGGAVRDHLLNRQPKDRDHVVVGADPEELISLGYRAVGQSYQVFLHPMSKEEYVLTDDLIADLARRDLTINSMALDEAGELIDPFGGRGDLESKVLRHTSKAFSEDPLRIYRVARFRSEFPDFTIAPETKRLMVELSATDAFRVLPGERIFGELRKALVSPGPALFFNTLRDLSILPVHFSECGQIKDWVRAMGELASFSRGDQGDILGFASLARNIGDETSVEKLCERLLVPGAWKNLAMASLELDRMLSRGKIVPEKLLDFFYHFDVFRNPSFLDLLILSRPEAKEKLQCSFHISAQVGVREIDPGLKGREIGLAIRRERERRLHSVGNPQESHEVKLPKTTELMERQIAPVEIGGPRKK